MSAAGWTAPAACAMLIAATLSAVSLKDCDSTASRATRDAVLSPPAERMQVQTSKLAACASCLETCIDEVPAGSLLIVGSLDRGARSHTVTVEWIDLPAECERVGQPCEAVPRPFDVRYLDHSEIPRYASISHAADCDGFAGQPRHLPGESREAVSARCESRWFLVPMIRHRQYASRLTSASLLARAGRMQVYNAKSPAQQPGAHDHHALAAAVINECESFIVPFVESQFTSIEDIDGDGFLTIVLCDLQRESTDGPLSNTEPILGCVRRSDFLPPHGDYYGDIIYLDRGLTPGADLTAVLTHEVTHAAAFSCIAKRLADSVVPGDRLVSVPGWLNEAIAHYMERRVLSTGRNLKSRVAAFYEAPSRFPLLVPEDQQLSAYGRGGCRAAGVLFLESFVRGNPEIGSLAHLLNSDDDPVQRLETLSGKSFAELFREWTVHLTAESNGPGGMDPAFSASHNDRRVTRQSLNPGDQVAFSLRGTAAAYFQGTSRRGSFVVSAPPDSELQITVIAADAPPRDADSPSASAVSAPGFRVRHSRAGGNQDRGTGFPPARE